MKISIIVAIDEKNAIGKNNQLLCHLPADMKMFRLLTTGHTLVMGRKTFESLPNGALPNRRNIVISRTLAEKEEENLIICSSLEKAFEICKEEDEVFIIGGANIYNETINEADFLYVTLIKHTFENADTFFPSIDFNKWREVSRENFAADGKNPYDYAFVKYARIL
ncbi:MAG: dihydrofolate reductase [Prevotellaceae bacterium]|jgi:dihydrofolate reductase|nr:dihydrofolate reductase [Prevotellaceae bacterium]